ncbi:DUF917 family protein [Sneathiella sp. P13V-1]|uniref:DUF917 domain-containing protein n=1 Tax=Sneathiella sp. P13V-1 TaxID=2697366 RepID=UPI00187B1712|nr:DUF917 domain-containing protein [Sneathiella sp. P13V-1]MBE7637092.1 DUF917 family protein [Sneathiella sp. P13V-1]
MQSHVGNVRELSIEDVEALSLGAWILGTGGGGSPYINLLNMKELYRQGYQATLMDPLTLDDDALVAVVSTQGAPIVGQERLANPWMSLRPLEIQEEYLGRKFDAVMPIEIGGGNGVLPLMIAAIKGIPALDADAMGRAYPEAQMTSFSVHNLSCAPLAMADIRENKIVVQQAEDWKWMERISRKIVTELGSTAPTCKAPRTGNEIKNCAVLHTATKAMDLGRAILRARSAHEDPVQAVIDQCDGLRIFTGKIVDIERRTTEGFLRGKAVISGLDEDQGDEFTLDFQNEFSVGSRGGQPIVMTPDLICVVDSQTGDGIATENLRYGQRVTVVALPAPDVFTTERGLELVGPRAFGFDFEFHSVFEG